MPRFLTPARLCLLVLIDIYAADRAPADVRLDILEFIALHTIPNLYTNHAGNTEPSRRPAPDAASFLAPVAQLHSEIPGRSMLDACLNAVWLMRSLDHLQLLFDRLQPLINAPHQPDDEHKTPKISRASPIGQFVRKCCVEWTRQQFSDAHALWNAFVLYRGSTYERWAHRNPDAAAEIIDHDLASSDLYAVGTGENKAAVMSSEDLDSLFEDSIQQLQKLGTRVPTDLHQQLRAWANEQYEFGGSSLQHFLSFFEHWRAGQYTMALESIHRYFDYSLAPKTGGSEDTKIYYQYALLHLSVLHADFGCWGESVNAMNECISTARENQDAVCLNFALSWLLYLRQANSDVKLSTFQSIIGYDSNGDGGSEDEIAFLKAKARDNKHWSLLSSTLLEQAKMEMSNGGEMDKALEHILQSAHANMQHDLCTLIPANSLFYGATMHRLGQAHLSYRSYESIQMLPAKICPLNDRVRSACRTAHALAQMGRYAKALDILQSMKLIVQGVRLLEDRIEGLITLVNFSKTLYHDGAQVARQFFSRLLPMRASSDLEFENEIAIAEVGLLIELGDSEAALKAVSGRITQLKSRADADIANRLQLLVLKGIILSSSGRSSKSFTCAIRAASTAERLRIIPVQLDAIGLLVEVLNGLSEFKASREIAEAILPAAIEMQHLKLTAQLYMQLCESHVGLAGIEGNAGTTAGRQRHLHAAEDYIERSRKAHEQMGHLDGMLDCLLRQAHIARWLNREELARRADSLYNELLSTKLQAAHAA